MEDKTATDADTVVAPGLGVLGSEGLHEFVRYFAASLIALIVDAGLLALLAGVAGMPYLWAGAIAFLAGLATVYLLSVRWVFSKRSLADSRIEALIFAVIGVVGLAINELVLYGLAGLLGFHLGLAKLASVGLVFFWNFGARKYLLFRGGAR
jgi:putative flippase GtrA